MYIITLLKPMIVYCKPYGLEGYNFRYISGNESLLKGNYDQTSSVIN